MRKLLTIIFLICAAYSFGQTPVPRSSAVVTAVDQRVAFMLNMKIPVSNDTTLNGGLDSIGLLIYRKIDSCIYLRVPVNGSQNKWINVMTSGETDTASLSARINLKLNISDTASMLSKYLRSIDTASLSNRINLKLNISDTASMLSKYLRKTDTASLSNRINLKVNISDTAAMLTPYLRKVDTVSLSNRVNGKVGYSDTAAMLSPYLRKIDTASLSNRINLKVNISDTAAMLNNYINDVAQGAGINVVRVGKKVTITATGGGGGGGSDSVWTGTSVALATLNDGTIRSATTIDYLGGSWRVDTADVTTANNWGNCIVDALGRRWRRIYTGLDFIQWYKPSGLGDSSLLRLANASCNIGIQFDSVTYNVHKFRPRSNRIYRGYPGKTQFRLTNASPSDPLDWRCVVLFNDSAGKRIDNVRFEGIKFNGNYANQLNDNTVVIRFGGNFGSSGTDTSTNIVFDNIQVDSSMRSAFWLLSDTNRNKNIQVLNSKFEHGRYAHVELRSCKDMIWDNCEFYTWSLADSTAACAFGGTNGTNNQPNLRLTVNNCRFINYHADRFTFEISGTVLSSWFTNNYMWGNGLDVNGFSGPAWFSCTFANNKMYNGGGGHRSGFELVGGGGNSIINNVIEGGTVTIGTNNGGSGVYIGLPAVYDSLKNNGYLIDGNTIINNAGAVSVGGNDSLRNVNVTNNFFFTGSGGAALSISGVRQLNVIDNQFNSNFYCIRFFDAPWSTPDTISRFIYIKDNQFRQMSFSANFPVVLFSTPTPATITKYRDVVFDGNYYNQNNLYYNDSTISSWTVVNNRKWSDTSGNFYFRNRAFIGANNTTPASVVGDIGSLYFWTTNDTYYMRTSTGWVALLTIAGSGGAVLKANIW